ncbi:MAG: hypothetical protein QXV20_06475, partial [Candidatus Hadarchaeales archaeon]
MPPPLATGTPEFAQRVWEAFRKGSLEEVLGESLRGWDGGPLSSLEPLAQEQRGLAHLLRGALALRRSLEQRDAEALGEALGALGLPREAALRVSWDRVEGLESLPLTEPGHRLLLAWMDWALERRRKGFPADRAKAAAFPVVLDRHAFVVWVEVARVEEVGKAEDLLLLPDPEGLLHMASSPGSPPFAPNARSQVETVVRFAREQKVSGGFVWRIVWEEGKQKRLWNVPLEGESLGLALAAALMGAARGRTPRKGWAASAALDGQGGWILKDVGQLGPKAEAVEKGGFQGLVVASTTPSGGQELERLLRRFPRPEEAVGWLLQEELLKHLAKHRRELEEDLRGKSRPFMRGGVRDASAYPFFSPKVRQRKAQEEGPPPEEFPLEEGWERFWEAPLAVLLAS